MLDFALEHYVTQTSTPDAQSKRKRVYRSELSKEAAQALLKYLTAHDMTEDEAVSYMTTHFNAVLSTQKNAPLGLFRKNGNPLVFTICGVLLILGGLIGLFVPVAVDTTFCICILLMGGIVLWTGFDPLPRAMSGFWKEKCQDADGMTAEDLEALHALVEKTARKGTLVS